MLNHSHLMGCCFLYDVGGFDWHGTCRWHHIVFNALRIGLLIPIRRCRLYILVAATMIPMRWDVGVYMNRNVYMKCMICSADAYIVALLRWPCDLLYCVQHGWLNQRSYYPYSKRVNPCLVGYSLVKIVGAGLQYRFGTWSDILFGRGGGADTGGIVCFMKSLMPHNSFTFNGYWSDLEWLVRQAVHGRPM